jgi:hypothetical protein
VFARESIEVNNIQETKSVLDEMGKRPISIIVICLGQNDFSQMNVLKNYSKKFEFIELKNAFNENYEKAVEWSLGEIGKQIIDYYKSVNFRNISISINSYNQSCVIYRSQTLPQNENEENEGENKEDEEENKVNEEKIIAKFYNFQKIHEEYKKKKESQYQFSSLKVYENENNIQQINQNNQNNQNNERFRLQASNKSEPYDNKSNIKNPYKYEANLLKQYNNITRSYNSKYNNRKKDINPYSYTPGMSEQNEKINRNTYKENDDDDFCILNK